MFIRLTQNAHGDKAPRTCYIPRDLIVFAAEKDSGTTKLKVHVAGGTRPKGFPPVFNVYVSEPISDVARRLGPDFVLLTQDLGSRRTTVVPGGRRVIIPSRCVSFAHAMPDGERWRVFLAGIDGHEDGDMPHDLIVWENEDVIFKNRGI